MWFAKTGIKLQNIQDQELFLTMETNIRGSISSVMGDRLAQSTGNTKVLYVDANNLYGWAMSQT